MSISIVIVAHAPLAGALKQCAVHVYACDKRTEDQLIAVDVVPDSDPEAVTDSLSALIATQHSEGVLVLTDVIGATPANIAEKMTKHGDTKVLSGVNLPMVLAALCHREEPLESVIGIVESAGQSSISTIG